MTLYEDPINGRVTESRLGRKLEAPAHTQSQWGSIPAKPFCNLAWLQSFPTERAQLSNGLWSDRQWYAFDLTTCLVKGFCQYDDIANALADEGLYPIAAYCDGNGPLAMATLWFNIIRDSVCGTYHEVVLSIDVSQTKSEKVAFQVGSANSPWAILYPNFSHGVCEAQFLHSLWINSPLSIAWGREMQGFPKHPQPVTSVLADEDQAFTFDLKWDDAIVLRGQTQKHFGLREFIQQARGLITTQKTMEVLRFLTHRSFDVPIVMPLKTTTQNQVPRHYVGHLWKGLSLAAVQVWPWGAGDTLEFGEIAIETGCEPHNGHRLLQTSKFQPVSVTYIPRMSAFVSNSA